MINLEVLSVNINSLSIYSFQYEKIIVGFSGGADSTALLLLLQAAAENSSVSSFKLEAVHFEHGLRGEESRNDAEWCLAFCDQRHIPVSIVHLDMNPDLPNIEAEARRKRLDYWKQLASLPKTAVALGHHADDKAENFFLRVLRGGNASSLTSLRMQREIEGIVFLRPLLDFTRSDIEDFLFQHGIKDWRRDKTNLELNHKRNIVRHKILPQLRVDFPMTDKAVAKSLYALQVDAEFIEAEAVKYFNVIKDLDIVDVDWFASLHKALLVRVLRYWLSRILGPCFLPTYDFINQFEYLMLKSSDKFNKSGERRTIQLPDNKSLVFEKGKVSVIKNIETVVINLDHILWNWSIEPSVIFNQYQFSAELKQQITKDEVFNNNKNIVFFDADCFSEEILIRYRQYGDKMIPFARNSLVTIKKLLESTRLTTDEKKRIPVLLNCDGEIFWLPGVRKSNFANLKFYDNKEIEKGNILCISCNRVT